MNGAERARFSGVRIQYCSLTRVVSCGGDRSRVGKYGSISNRSYPPRRIAMPSILDQMTAIYVFVDDYLKAHPHATQWRRSHHSHPAFTDAEVITLALL